MKGNLPITLRKAILYNSCDKILQNSPTLKILKSRREVKKVSRSEKFGNPQNYYKLTAKDERMSNILNFGFEDRTQV